MLMAKFEAEGQWWNKYPFTERVPLGPEEMQWHRAQPEKSVYNFYFSYMKYILILVQIKNKK